MIMYRRKRMWRQLTYTDSGQEPKSDFCVPSVFIKATNFLTALKIINFSQTTKLGRWVGIRIFYHDFSRNSLPVLFLYHFIYLHSALYYVAMRAAVDYTTATENQSGQHWVARFSCFSLLCTSHAVHFVGLQFLSLPNFTKIWCDFDRASSLICGNKMPTRCNRGFYCRSYCLLNMFRAPLCPSSGAQEYYTVVAACGISCCKMHATIHHVHSHTITPYKRDTWPTDQAIHYKKKPTKNTHTQPPRHLTHLVTNLDNTRHLRLRTQIPQKLTKLFFTFLQHEIPQAATTV